MGKLAGLACTMYVALSRCQLSYVKQLILQVRCIRQDCVVPAIRYFVSQTLGTRFTESPAFNLAESFAESECKRPLLIVLSVGTDPTAAVLKFAELKGMASRISVISMGQGQVRFQMNFLYCPFVIGQENVSPCY